MPYVVGALFAVVLGAGIVGGAVYYKRRSQQMPGLDLSDPLSAGAIETTSMESSLTSEYTEL